MDFDICGKFCYTHVMNRLSPIVIQPQPCPAVCDEAEIAERHQEFLGDESRVRAEKISALYFPRSAAETSGALQEIAQHGRRCVFSGGRTGIAAGAVPLEAEAVISFAHMKRLLAFGCDRGEYYVRVEPGLTLRDLMSRLEHKDVANLPEATADEAETAVAFMARTDLRLWLPVDPTEQSAQIGGAVATNASGSRSYRYGAMRSWVRGLALVLADGRLLRLRRGQVNADGCNFILAAAGGGEVAIQLPEMHMPAAKCNAGYFLQPGMDAIDLFIGSEGTLAAIVEIELRLAPRPPAMIGVLALVADEDKALSLVEAAQNLSGFPLQALEYFDHDTLALLRQKKKDDGAGSAIPDLPFWEGEALYFELSGSAKELDAGCEKLEYLLASVDSSLEQTWAATDEAGIERQKIFRHAAPETINLHISRLASRVRGLHKIGTDMAVPRSALRKMFGVYRSGLTRSGLASAIFGHIGDSHVHVNILPNNLHELQKAKELYAQWAAEAVRLGGSVAAEHGIGRLKKNLLAIQYPPPVLEGMRRLRSAFDPQGILAPGVMLP